MLARYPNCSRIGWSRCCEDPTISSTDATGTHDSIHILQEEPPASTNHGSTGCCTLSTAHFGVWCTTIWFETSIHSSTHNLLLSSRCCDIDLFIYPYALLPTSILIYLNISLSGNRWMFNMDPTRLLESRAYYNLHQWCLLHIFMLPGWWPLLLTTPHISINKFIDMFVQ